MIRSVALWAMSVLCCLNASLGAEAPLAVYYSFDSPPPTALLTEMQSELARILLPSGMSATWRATDALRKTGEDFPAVVVFRFSGRCAFDDTRGGTAADPDGQALGETKIIDGHILPFSTVDCDRVRALIAADLSAMPPAWKTPMLGRAVARVGAHEIFHMLAGVEAHDDRGIFRSAHSRSDLTAATFSFAAPENNWLHKWLQRQVPEARVIQALQVHDATASDDNAFIDPDAAAATGR
jgi:hypothetical protein